MLTGDSVVSAISIKLNSSLQGRINKYYKNTPEQDAVGPYVYIKSVLNNISPMLKNYYWMEYTVDVICVPEKNSTTVHSWARQLALDLSIYLSSITIEGYPCKARNVSYEIVDGVLHFIVDYSFRAYLDDGTRAVLMRILDYHEYRK